MQSFIPLLFSIRNLLIIFAYIIFCIYLFKIIDKFLTKKSDELGNYIKGDIGESKVLKEIINISPTFRTFRKVTLPNMRGDIDIIVVTNIKIYAIEVKNWEKSLDQTNKDLLKTAKQQAAILSGYIEERLNIKLDKKLYVEPLIVSINNINNYLNDNIINIKHLKHHMSKYGIFMSSDLKKEIVDILNKTNHH